MRHRGTARIWRIRTLQALIEKLSHIGRHGHALTSARHYESLFELVGIVRHGTRLKTRHREGDAAHEINIIGVEYLIERHARIARDEACISGPVAYRCGPLLYHAAYRTATTLTTIAAQEFDMRRESMRHRGKDSSAIVGVTPYRVPPRSRGSTHLRTCVARAARERARVLIAGGLRPELCVPLVKITTNPQYALIGRTYFEFLRNTSICHCLLISSGSVSAARP